MNRGWYILGILIFIASFPFHQALLSVIGLLLILVVGVTDVWEKFCLRNLRYQRRFSEQRALFGERVTLSLSVENAKLLPLPWVEARDAIPRALPIAERQVNINVFGDSYYLDNMFSARWYERVTRRYTVLCNARGVHKFGPTTLRSGDVFGFLTRDETLNNLQYLLVYPLIVPLTRFSLPARHPFGERRAPRRLLEDPSRIIGVRDYVYGDSLRRVHWKATARAMQLQSKVYEATTTYTLITFLNVAPHFDTHYGLQPELRELAICAAASVADWALNQGYAVGLYANTLMFMPETDEYGEEQSNSQSPARLDIEEQKNIRRIHLPPATSEEQRGRILETLARIQPYHGSDIEDVIQAERTRLPAGATVVVVTSTVSERLLDTLSRVRQSGHAVTILFTGETPPPTRFAGVTVYHLGGSAMWRQLEAAYSVEDSGDNRNNGDTNLDNPAQDDNNKVRPVKTPIGLQL